MRSSLSVSTRSVRFRAPNETEPGTALGEDAVGEESWSEASSSARLVVFMPEAWLAMAFFNS